MYLKENKLREGVWEGAENYDYVDGLIFFYVTNSAEGHARKLKSEYETPTTNDARKFKQKFKQEDPNQKDHIIDFFDKQIAYFHENSKCYVAFCRCIEIYSAPSSPNNTKRNFARFDLNKFYALNTPIKKEDFDTSLKEHGIESFSEIRHHGKPCYIPAQQAQHLLNMIAHDNRAHFIDKNRGFGNWLQRYTIVDDSNYTNKGLKNAHAIIFDEGAYEDQDIRAYWANPFVNALANTHDYNADVKMVYRERFLRRTDELPNSLTNYTNEDDGFADYVIQVGNTSSKYWLPVEVKIDITKENDFLNQVKKYTYRNRLLNPHTKKSMLYSTHGVVLVLDKNGVYITKNGSFLQECGFGKPMWERKNFTEPDVLITDIRTRLISELRKTAKEYNNARIIAHQNTPHYVSEKSIPKISDNTLDINKYLITALQPLRPYAGADRMLMNNVALLADSINVIQKDTCPVESLWLCTPVSNNVYFTRIDDVWFPVHINYTGKSTTIDYKKYTNIKEFQAPSAVISIEEHGISLVASIQGLDIMYTDENGNTTTLHKKIPINTPDDRSQARQTILECYSESE